MKTNSCKTCRLAFVFFSFIILLTAGCKKDSKPAAPVCRPVKMVAFPNNGHWDITYTWSNQLIIKAEWSDDGDVTSAIFEYNSNNRISKYKRYLRSGLTPDHQYNFYYNSDGTYSKIENFDGDVLESYFEFQNSNGNIMQIKRIEVVNGQPAAEPSVVWEFSYANKNVSKVIGKAGGYVETKSYTYDDQPNHLKKIHEQYPIIDYSLNNYWTFSRNVLPFFWGTNQNNCIAVSTKTVAPDGTTEEYSSSWYYQLDDKGNLKQFGIPPTSTSDYVMGRYTYECN